MPDATRNLLLDFFANLNQTAILWQILVLALSMLLAWGINRILPGRLPGSEAGLKIDRTGLPRPVFPVVALALVLIGREILKNWHSVNLLDIAIPMLFALVLIRIFAYLLRQVLSPGNGLHGSEQFIAMTIWLVFTLHLTGLLPEILNALDYLSIHIGRQRISLLMIISGIFSIMVTMLLAMWVGRTLERRVMAAENLEMNLRVVLSKLISAALLVIGILIALPLAGIDITVLSVFGGALGVGMGLGLQKIASNYVSGFIILLDRSIHPGDVLTVDGHFGKVTQFTTRYLVLEDNDGTEAIIPNETLIGSTVINHSYSNRQIRISIPVQIGYQSDLQRAMQIMQQAAAHQPRVLTDPEPVVYLKSFGDNGINLEMGIWIEDPEKGQLSLCSDINMEIWREFQAANIEIPYPQRDIRIIASSPAESATP